MPRICLTDAQKIKVVDWLRAHAEECAQEPRAVLMGRAAADLPFAVSAANLLHQAAALGLRFGRQRWDADPAQLDLLLERIEALEASLAAQQATLETYGSDLEQLHKTLNGEAAA